MTNRGYGGRILMASVLAFALWPCVPVFSLDPPVIESCTFGSGYVDLVLTSAGEGAETYNLYYGGAPGVPSGRKTGITVAMSLHVPFFGYDPSCGEGTVYVTLKSADASGAESQPSNEASCAVTTAWPDVTAIVDVTDAMLNPPSGVVYFTSDHTYRFSGTRTVPSGKTLAIEAGTALKFNLSSYLKVDGSLQAEGDACRRIYFTSVNDTVGAPTGNGNPQKGEWSPLTIHSAACTGCSRAANLKYCTIRYGGQDYLQNLDIGLWGDNQVSLDHCEVAYSQRKGAYVHCWTPLSGPATLWTDSVVFRGNTDSALAFANLYLNPALYVQAPDGHLDLSFLDNYSTNPGHLSAAVEIEESAAAQLVGPGTVVASGNKCNGILWKGGTVSAALRWFDLGVPFVITGSSSATVTTGGGLTIDPGVTVKLWEQHLVCHGTFQAQGSAGAPILFTSYRDDTDGDTNGDGTATSPARGDWRTIQIHPSSCSGCTRSAVVEHCVFRYGGRDVLWNAEVHNWPDSTVALSHCTFSHSQGRGLDVYGPAPSSRLTLEHLRFENNQNHGLGLHSCRWAELRHCVWISNNTWANPPYQVSTDTTPCFVDASLCYWGTADLDGQRFLQDGWRLSPWYVADPGWAPELEMEDWTGDFNPAPDSQVLTYKDSFRLALSRQEETQWRVRVLASPSGTVLHDSVLVGSGMDFTWGAGQATGKYEVEISDASETGAFHTLKAAAWADTGLFAAMPTPLANSYPGVVTGDDLSYTGVLARSVCTYSTSLWHHREGSSSPSSLAAFPAQCVGAKDAPVTLAPADATALASGEYSAFWMGSAQANPARWIGFRRDFAVANLFIAVSPSEASGTPSGDDLLHVTVDASGFPGTVALLEPTVSRRTYAYDPALNNPCAYCCHRCTRLPDTVNFLILDSPLATLTGPIFEDGVYHYTWASAGHGDGLYAVPVHVHAILGGQGYETTLGNTYRNKDLPGWVGPQSPPATVRLEIVDPDGCGRFKYDGRHLIKYVFPAGWTASFTGQTAPVIAAIMAGILADPSLPGSEAFFAYDRTIMDFDGIGTGERVWYWDGVLKNRRISRAAPFYTHNYNFAGFMMAEQIRPAAPTECLTSCGRAMLALEPHEFVLKGFGDIVDPVVMTCCSSGGSPTDKIAVTVRVMQSANLQFKVWRTGELDDSSIPSQASIASAVIPVAATPGQPVEYTWSHNGLVGGRRLMEGLYEVEVIATAQVAPAVVQKAYQTLPVSW